MEDFTERFWSRCDKTGANGCWTWSGSKTTAGYGNLRRDGRYAYAHRVAYEIANGPIPTGMLIDHTCHHPSCVNPAHLRVADKKGNSENQGGPISTNTSGVRGVAWHSQQGRWRAYATHHGRQVSGGLHDSLESAEAAAIALRLELFTHNDLDRV